MNRSKNLPCPFIFSRAPCVQLRFQRSPSPSQPCARGSSLRVCRSSFEEPSNGSDIPDRPLASPLGGFSFQVLGGDRAYGGEAEIVGIWGHLWRVLKKGRLASSIDTSSCAVANSACASVGSEARLGIGSTLVCFAKENTTQTEHECCGNRFLCTVLNTQLPMRWILAGHSQTGEICFQVVKLRPQHCGVIGAEVRDLVAEMLRHGGSKGAHTLTLSVRNSVRPSSAPVRLCTEMHVFLQPRIWALRCRWSLPSCRLGDLDGAVCADVGQLVREQRQAVRDDALDGWSRKHRFQQVVKWLLFGHQAHEAPALWRTRGGADEMLPDAGRFAVKKQRLCSNISNQAGRAADSLRDRHCFPHFRMRTREILTSMFVEDCPYTFLFLLTQRGTGHFLFHWRVKATARRVGFSN